MNAEQQIISVNKAFCRSTHYDFYEVIGEDLGFLLEESGTEPLSAQIQRTMLDKESWQGEVRFRRRSGRDLPGLAHGVGRARGQGAGAVANHIGIAIDITDRKRSEERIQFLAHHDVLTELPNRSLCVQAPADGAGAGAPLPVKRSRCCSSTWTVSRPSTTRWATTLATACCARWPHASRRPCAAATP